ncbi:cytidylate kinase family protein [Brachybacterium sp. GPGPB12]|uniref:cytidylate kinase family protein n=1 Tax=Brachybacterium sp. GPGPB12 TaxID=3023517 RepID=UPI003134255D
MYGGFEGRGIIDTQEQERTLIAENDATVHRYTEERGEIVGRSATVLLAVRPRDLHVLLTVDSKTRIVRAAERAGISHERAAKRQKREDQVQVGMSKVAAAGSQILERREARPRMEFFDIGAVAWILRKCLRWVPGARWRPIGNTCSRWTGSSAATAPSSPIRLGTCYGPRGEKRGLTRRREVAYGRHRIADELHHTRSAYRLGEPHAEGRLEIKGFALAASGIGGLMACGI